MINNPVVSSAGGGNETATVTIHGPSGFLPIQTLVYLHGGGVDYVDVLRNQTHIIQVDSNTFIAGANYSASIMGGAENKLFGMSGTSVIVVTGDCEIQF